MVKAYKGLLMALGFRFLLATPLFALAVITLLASGANVVGLLVGMLFMVLGCGVVASPFARLLAEPIGNLFYTVEHFDTPQPIYSIPEAKVQERKYEEAMILYQEITEQYPDQPKAYIGMMKVSAVYLKDARRTEKIFHQGLIGLTRKRDKDNLAVAYKAMRSQLGEKPEWTQERRISLKQEPEAEA